MIKGCQSGSCQIFTDNSHVYGRHADLLPMRTSAFSAAGARISEKSLNVTGVKITVANTKARISNLGYSAGPIIVLLVTLVVGFLNPHAFENNDFLFWILFFGVLWLLVYGADPLKNAEAITACHKEETIKFLKSSASSVETPPSGERFDFATRKWVPR